MISSLVAAAIAGIGALKSNDDKKRAHQEAINAAEQQMWDQRNAAILAKRDARRGLNPQDEAFARNLGEFRDQVGAMPVAQDWTPLVAALGQGASAIYEGAEKGMFDGKNMHPDPGPTHEDVPGQNFSPAGNHAAPVNYSEWQPIEHRRAGSGGSAGNIFSRAAARFEEDDERALPEWLR